MKNQIVKYKSQWTIVIYNKRRQGYIVSDSKGGFGYGSDPETAISGLRGAPHYLYETQKSALEAMEKMDLII